MEKTVLPKSYSSGATRTKSSQAYGLLKKALLDGDFSHGERLTEAKVSRKLKLGRGPARESLLRLEAEGLIKGKGPYGGKFVEYLEDLELEEIIERYELRDSIEGQAARLAAKNMTGWQIDELRKCAEELAKQMKIVQKPEDGCLRLEASLHFHDYLLANCGNALLYKVWKRNHLAPLGLRSTALSVKIKSKVPDRIKQDGFPMAVVEAIAAHDPELAEDTMRKGVRRITEAIRRTLSKKPKSKTG